MTKSLLLSLLFTIGCAPAFAQTPTPMNVTVTANTIAGTQDSGAPCGGSALLPVGTVFTATDDVLGLGLSGYSATNATGQLFVLALSGGEYVYATGGGIIEASKGPATINQAAGIYLGSFSCTGTLEIVDGVLPVTLTSFTGEYNSKSISLKWNTAQEEGNEGFEVQRSTEGQNWAMLDFVASINDGNTAGDYSLVDSDPLPGVNYYRLKQMNYDGSFVYSEIISTVAGGSEDLLVFPNPAQEVLNVRFVTDEATPYRVVNAKGVEVLRGMLSSGGDVSVGELPAGVYHLSIDGKAGVVTQRFLKQ